MNIRSLTAPSSPTSQSTVALLLALSTFTMAPTVQAAAEEDSRWLFRAGSSFIAPKQDNGMLTAGSIDVDNASGFSFNVAYYFTPNLAVDVLAALPFKHIFSINGEIFDTTQHLPPTVTLQYHFMPASRVQPFVGLGLNYTLFFDEQLAGPGELDLDPSFGLAAQIGLDVPLNDRWRVGLDARYIDIDTDASVDGQDIGTVEIDPIVYSVNLGYRF